MTNRFHLPATFLLSITAPYNFANLLFVKILLNESQYLSQGVNRMVKLATLLLKNTETLPLNIIVYDCLDKFCRAHTCTRAIERHLYAYIIYELCRALCEEGFKGKIVQFTFLHNVFEIVCVSKAVRQMKISIERNFHHDCISFPIEICQRSFYLARYHNLVARLGSCLFGKINTRTLSH